MATKAKESCGLGKERKITAPSSIPIPNTPTKRTPKSSPRGPSTEKQPFSSTSSSSTPHSTLSEKPVPNYLKFTASSRPDHTSFKPIKKPSGPTPIPEGKPGLNRRRSFDKPPPTTPRLDKPFRSPGPRNRATHVPVRSSSFGAKSSTTIISSSKPGFLERSSSKISKVGGGKPQQQVQTLKSSINVKKSLKRESSNAASASAAEMVPKTKNAVEHVDRSPSFLLGMNEENLKKIECELDPYLPDPMPELDKKLSSDQVEKKVVLDKEEADSKDKAEKKLHHHQPAQETEIFIVGFSNKEADETPQAADAESSIGEEANRERNEGEREEGSKEEEKPERIAVEKEEVVAVVASEESTDNTSEEKTVTEEEEAQDEQSYKEENHSSTTKAETTEKEAKAAEKVAAAEAAEKEVEVVAEKAAAAVGKPRQGGPGRKESPAMYNHVIEETASKLLEERKNKVRALAGAFQTVIDYESSSK